METFSKQGSDDKALVLWDAIVENHSNRSSSTAGHCFVVVFRLGLIENCGGE